MLNARSPRRPWNEGSLPFGQFDEFRHAVICRKTSFMWCVPMARVVAKGGPLQLLLLGLKRFAVLPDEQGFPEHATEPERYGVGHSGLRFVPFVGRTVQAWT